MRDRIRLGTLVTLRVPGSPLDGTEAQVDYVEDWGAHVYAPAAVTKRFRAHWSEMELREGVGANGFHKQEVKDTGYDVRAKEQGYAGEICGKCGGSHLRRTGACTTCEDCFESGCS